MASAQRAGYDGIAVIGGDGKSNWYKGVQLITLYILIAIMFYVIPDGAGGR